MTTGRPSLAPGILLAGDLLALVLFAVLGLASHDEGVTASGLARTALPILGAWLIAAGLVGTYRRPGLRTLLPAWTLGVTLGVVVRGLLPRQDLDGDTAVFLGVALGVSLALLLAWRGLAAALARLVAVERSRDAPSR